MAISAQYSKEVRENLSYFPSWEPGDSVSPGDVGELDDDGVFHRQTTLRKLFPQLPLLIRRDAKPNRMGFQSENSVSVHSKEAASIPGSDSRGDSATVEITFSRGGAVVFDAANLSRRFIENLHEIRAHIEKHRKSWPRKYVLVSHVEEAESFAVLISGAAGASVSLTGKLTALRHFDLAEGSVSIVNSRNIGYQRIGTGPILLRVYGLGFFGKTKLLSKGEEQRQDAEETFQELSPHAF